MTRKQGLQNFRPNFQKLILHWNSRSLRIWLNRNDQETYELIKNKKIYDEIFGANFLFDI